MDNMTELDDSVLVKKLLIFDYKIIKNIICSNCERNINVVVLYNHKKYIFCSLECFWSYFLERDTLNYKKSYMVKIDVYSEKNYIIEYFRWDFIDK